MRRAVLIPLLGLLLVAIGSTPAKAALSITEFETTTTTSEAGAHPDLHTRFKLQGAGAPEAAKNITFNAPQGVFGNPAVLTACDALNFALQACPSNSQVGLITIRANYLGDPDFLLGTVPIYSIETAGDEAARFGFVAPVVNIPIAIPVTVRSASDYGLRFTVSGITETTPLSEADLTFWGFPADSSHDAQRFPKGSLEHPAGCPEQADASCNPVATRASVPPRPFTGNPSVCGTPMPTTLDVETYQRPNVLVHAAASYPSITNCERQSFKPFAQARLTTDSVDSPSGMEYEFVIPQGQARAASPSMLRAAKLVLPVGLTINPDAADGQGACSPAEAGFGAEGPGHCPDRAKAGTFKVHSESLPGDLEGSIYLGEPTPGNQYRLFLFADAFGIHAKLIA